ncbi:histidine triad (HIT) family protein [Scopulibacillus darangshiensis]|uniref:Histidine triad (HIT) family protein n=1 Tax=Scopulibacillus darangshiensis TaxID=442528 RepID=A0A4R2P3J7_9BACL|nr:HIT family protein [Scopulibacillus darangshiensis]TCP29273.1 histidine triad (HIT) family protein [Scopulibacillus darangshiensis]
MAHDPNCIFCKIISGEIPSAKVYENEDVYAFLDISQNTKGHTLVIPKEHTKDIYDLTPDTAANLFRAVPRIATAVRDAFDPIGLNLLNNNGEFAGQSVFHYHIHILPRYGKGDGFGAVWHSHESDYSNEDRENIAHQISNKLS